MVVALFSFFDVSPRRSKVKNTNKERGRLRHGNKRKPCIKVV